MILYGDYHTHTNYTHGKNSVLENVQAARKRGLKQIAITEHSFSHMAYGITRGEYNLLRLDCEKVNKQFDDIDVFCGLESNIVSLDGDIDVLQSERKAVDVLVVGFHKSFKCGFKAFFNFFIPNVLGIGRKSKKQILKNTQAYIKAIRKNKIDILAHLKSNGCLVDPVAIAKVAKEYNTYIELNGKRMDFTPTEIEGMIQTGVKFIISSDAHSMDKVGENNVGLAVVEKYNIPPEQIVNLDRVPKFKYCNKNEKE